MTASELGNSAFLPSATFSLSSAWSQLLFGLGPASTWYRPRPSIIQVSLAPASSKSASSRHHPGRSRPSIIQVGLALASFRSALPQPLPSRPCPDIIQVGLAPALFRSALPRPLPSRPRPGIVQIGLASASSKSASPRYHSARPQTPQPRPRAFRLGPDLEPSSSPRPRPRAFHLGPGLEPSSSAPTSIFLLGPGLERSSSAPALSVPSWTWPRDSAPASSLSPRPRPRAFLLGHGLQPSSSALTSSGRPRLLKSCRGGPNLFMLAQVDPDATDRWDLARQPNDSPSSMGPSLTTE